MENKIKIQLVEDNKLIRVGIRTLLNDYSEYEIINEAETGKEAILSAQKYTPDIIIIDLGLSDMSGIKVIKELQDNNITSKFIVLTSHDSADDVNKCLALGIYAYVIKDIDAVTLINIIKTVYNGAMWFDPKIVPFLRNQKNEVITTGKIPRKVFKNTHSNLTQREFEVLKLIVDGKSNFDIAQELCISEHTAKAHVCNIIQKLVVDDRTQAAVKAVKEGIIQ